MRGDIGGECGVPVDEVSGDDEEGGSGELFDDVCIGCRSEKFHFNRARSFARYQDSLVRAIVLLKFAEMEPLADVVRENRKALEADVIVPVPLHQIRRRERGFNQAEMLSKRLAKRRKLPHQGVLLVRKRPRPDQHLLATKDKVGGGSWCFCHTSGQPS
jgi:predicted amidophosphoribosyltransferase